MNAIKGACCLVPVLFAAIASCSGNSDGSLELGVTATALSPATLRAERVSTTSGLRLTITSVRIHVADAGKGDDPMMPGKPDDNDDKDKDKGDKNKDDDKGNGWLTIFSGTETVDLFAAVATETVIGSIPMTGGKLTEIRVVLANNPVLVVDGISMPVQCPSCTESGIKVIMPKAIALAQGSTLNLALEIDQNASLSLDGGFWRLDPVIHLKEAIVN